MNLITKAKARLVVEHPFFASLLLGMPMIEDKSIRTIETDGETVWYSPDFMGSLTLAETTFVLAHEVMHCVFQHMYRRKERDPNKWNIAGDYIINDMLITDKIGVMPSGDNQGLHNPKLVAQGNGTTEGVYNLLPDSDSKKEAGYPGQGGSIDRVRDGAKDQASMAQKEAEMKVKICQARNAAKTRGKLSAGLERLIEDFTKSKTDWRAVLRRFITERAKTDLSYAKPKRRFLADDIFLPSLTGEKIGTILIAVDCSGSISDDILKLFSREIKGIFEDTHPETVHVVYFDTEVLRCDTFKSDDNFQIKAIGGGGTAFSPVWKYVDDKGLEPIACVFLTDLYCSDFGNAPDYPVLWTTIGDTKAPFGEVIQLKE